MTNLILGILIGIILTIFFSWCMAGESVTDTEIGARLDWREEWIRREKP